MNTGSPSNLQIVTADYTVAVERMETLWAQVRAMQAWKLANSRLMARYIRSLRACQRIRQELLTLTEKGKL